MMGDTIKGNHFMKSLRLLAGLSAFALIAFAAPAIAGPVQPFSTAALRAAQTAGRPVLVDVHADWCPTCRRQAPTVTEISRDPAFAKLVILKLDYDSQVAEKKALGVRMQSTLIAFKGARETARATGITDREKRSRPSRWCKFGGGHGSSSGGL